VGHRPGAPFRGRHAVNRYLAALLARCLPAAAGRHRAALAPANVTRQPPPTPAWDDADGCPASMMTLFDIPPGLARPYVQR
jgi:hypothetical protein